MWYLDWSWKDSVDSQGGVPLSNPQTISPHIVAFFILCQLDSHPSQVMILCSKIITQTQNPQWHLLEQRDRMRSLAENQAPSPHLHLLPPPYSWRSMSLKAVVFWSSMDPGSFSLVSRAPLGPEPHLYLYNKSVIKQRHSLQNSELDWAFHSLRVETEDP